MELESEVQSQAAELSALMAELGPAEVKKTISPCLECQKNSRVGHLKQYHVNLDENLVFCDNELCSFMGDPASVTQSHKPTDDSDLNDILSSLLTSELDEADPLASPSHNDIFNLSDSCTSHFSEQTPSTENRDLVGSPIGSGGCLVSDGASTASSAYHSLSPSLSGSHPGSPSSTTSDVYSCTTNSSYTDNSVNLENIIFTRQLENSTNTISNLDSSLRQKSLKSSANDTKTPAEQHAVKHEIIPSQSAPLLTHIPNLSSTKLVQPDSEIATELPMKHVTPAKGEERHRYMMLWSNIDALCWLDVLLAALCHNHSLRLMSESLPYSSVMKKLLLAYDEAQALIEPLQAGDKSLLHTVMEHDKLSVKRGGGYCLDTSSSLLDSISKSTVLSSHEISSAKRKIHLAAIKLECAREEMWQAIEPQLGCERGKDNSPVFAFPLLAKTDKDVEKLFVTEYTWTTRCAVCHHEQVISEKSHMITFPKIAKFEMNKCMTHYRVCIKCLAPDQKRQLDITRFAPNLAMHFSDGMKHSDLDALRFVSNTESRYMVSAVVEYKTSPNHFILWQRDVQQSQPGNWMCYNDLQSQYAQFSISNLSVPAHNIHIVFWEAIQPVDKTFPNIIPMTGECMAHGKVLISNGIPTASGAQFSPAPMQVADNVTQDGLVEQKVCSEQTTVKTSDGAATPGGAQLTPSANVAAKHTAPPLSSISKSLVTNDKRNVSSSDIVRRNTALKRRPVSLISNPIGSKRPLTEGIRYGTPPPSALHVDQKGSYRAIVSAVYQMAPSTPECSTFNDIQRTYHPPKTTASRSYLDMVQPLLQRNKEKKGRGLTGYVPKSQRALDDKPVKPKARKVMFTGIPSPTPSTVAPPKVNHTPIAKLHCPTTQAPGFRVRDSIMRRQVSTLVDNFVPYSERQSTASSKQELEMDDMPSLDDMLKDLC